MIYMPEKCYIKRGSRVLILEDNKKRVSGFNQSLIGCYVECFSSVRKIISSLEEESWDYLFLDHDLDGKIFVPSGPGTGYEVAQWLKNHPDNMPVKVIVHSLNDIAQPLMAKVLPEALIIPGAWLLIDIIDD